MASTQVNTGDPTREELRIVMVGKTGVGKSETGNTILGRQCFETKFSAVSLTAECSKGVSTLDRQKVAVIDTPGLFDTKVTQEKTKEDIAQCISFSSPGPHVFLVVIRLGRFTQEESNTVQMIQEMFGPAADKYSMVLFTHGDLLRKTTIEEFMKDSTELQEIVRRCNGQYHVFNNTLTDRSQVTELLQKIRDIVQKNGGSHYTTEMFQEAERTIEEEKRRILREKEQEKQKEKEELEKTLRAEFDEKLKKLIQQHRDEMEEEKRQRERERCEMNAQIRDLRRDGERLADNLREMEMAKDRALLKMQNVHDMDQKEKESLRSAIEDLKLKVTEETERSSKQKSETEAVIQKMEKEAEMRSNKQKSETEAVIQKLEKEAEMRSNKQKSEMEAVIRKMEKEAEMRSNKQKSEMEAVIQKLEKEAEMRLESEKQAEAYRKQKEEEIQQLESKYKRNLEAKKNEVEERYERNARNEAEKKPAVVGIIASIFIRPIVAVCTAIRTAGRHCILS